MQLLTDQREPCEHQQLGQHDPHFGAYRGQLAEEHSLVQVLLVSVLPVLLVNPYQVDLLIYSLKTAHEGHHLGAPLRTHAHNKGDADPRKHVRIQHPTLGGDGHLVLSPDLDEDNTEE